MLKLVSTISAAAFALALAAAPASAFTGEKYAKFAKIDLNQAKEVALKARAGKITDSELEYEKGGSGLRYSFDIGSHGKTYEVGVDAKTGAVLENDTEGTNPD